MQSDSTSASAHLKMLIIIKSCYHLFIFLLIDITHMLSFQGGMYVLQIMDSYAPSYGLLVVGLSECLVISYVYGMYILY